MYRTPRGGILVVNLDQVVEALNSLVMPFSIPADGAAFCNKGKLWAVTIQMVNGRLCASCFPREPIIVRAEKGFWAGQIACQVTVDGRMVYHQAFEAQGQTFLLSETPEIGQEVAIGFAKIRNAGRCLETQ